MGHQTWVLGTDLWSPGRAVKSSQQLSHLLSPFPVTFLKQSLQSSLHCVGQGSPICGDRGSSSGLEVIARDGGGVRKENEVTTVVS